jgi:hypothetical protein
LVAGPKVPAKVAGKSSIVSWNSHEGCITICPNIKVKINKADFDEMQAVAEQVAWDEFVAGGVVETIWDDNRRAHVACGQSEKALRAAGFIRTTGTGYEFVTIPGLVRGENTTFTLAEVEEAAGAAEDAPKAQTKEQAAIVKAQATGGRQLISSHAAECMSCGQDVVATWAMPDGTVKVERHHTV